MPFDLLTTVETGGCSAKLPATELAEALSGLPKIEDPNLLVDIDTHDDAGVYQLTDDLAIIQTTDFFPPICSDPYEFGQIAAANSLSDVYAMGGKAVSALNLVLFPHKKIPLDILKEILRGGIDKVQEAGAVIAGGHTINDDPPKYGLAVTGTIHPQKIITNGGARPGEVLILTKPLGTGILVSGHKAGAATDVQLQNALDCMKQLNNKGAEIMQKYNVKGATDITGFGLFGHALKMAMAGGITISLDTKTMPLLPGVLKLAEQGCLPCAAFRNREYIQDHCQGDIDHNLLMIGCDAQTSGGLLMAVNRAEAPGILKELHAAGYGYSAISGEVKEKRANWLEVV
ncbi:selenide, water dikinase SelD [Candidatus Margulisiibacteriota bacterium]